VVNPFGTGIAIVQDPALEAEADAIGRRIAEAAGTRAVVAQRMENKLSYPSTSEWKKQMKLNAEYGLSAEDEKWLKIAYCLGLECPILGHASRNSNGSANKADDAKAKFSKYMKVYCAKKYRYEYDDMPLNKAWAAARKDGAHDVILPG
jgi:hypothetical protein